MIPTEDRGQCRPEPAGHLTLRPPSDALFMAATGAGGPAFKPQTDGGCDPSSLVGEHRRWTIMVGNGGRMDHHL